MLNVRLTLAQKTMFMQCPNDWDAWGQMEDFGHYISRFGFGPTLGALERHRLVETRLRGETVWWRRAPGVAPQPTLIDITVEGRNPRVISRKKGLTNEVTRWLNENAHSGWFYNKRKFAFASSSEAVLFKLCWL